MTVKVLTFPLLAWFVATVASAQPAIPVISARSFSGQFTAREMKGRPRLAPSPAAVRVPIAGGLAFLLTAPQPSATVATDKVPLEPALLAISCERVKELFLLELGLQDEWRGRVDLIINRSLKDDREPELTAIHSHDGWNYELELPKNVQPQILVRAVIQSLLAELLNRQAGTRPAEIPFWLVDGISAHLQAFNLPTFIIRPNVQSAGYQRLTIEGMEEVRAVLRQHAPLTFQQLSWPEKSDVAGQGEALYRCCAQLLFESLLHLDDGQASLRLMLEEMPKHLNWQTAFLVAFHSHFPRMLDVEKWWALNCVSFMESDLTAPRTALECWHKLQAALDVPVEVQLTPVRKPTAAMLTLQEAIQEWDPADAEAAVQRSVRELEGLQWFTYRSDLNLDASFSSASVAHDAQGAQGLQMSMTRELSPLVTQYLVVLLNYMKHSEAGATLTTEGKVHRSNSASLKKEVVRQLNDLDQKRELIRAGLLAASSGSKAGLLQTGAGKANTNKGRPHP